MGKGSLKYGVAALVVAAPAGCTALLGIQPATLQPDAGDGSAVVETSDDASAAETSIVGDANVSPCKSGNHLFCDDFDRGMPLVGNWSVLALSAGTNLELSTARFVSPPQSLHASIPISNFAYAQLRRNINTLASSHLAFDVFVPMSASNLTVAVVGFLGTGSALLFDVGVATGCSLYYFIEQADSSGLEAPCSGSFPKETWVHVDIDFAMPDGGTARASAKIDGVTQVADALLGPVNLGSGFHLTVGLSGYNMGEVWVDNVVFDGN